LTELLPLFGFVFFGLFSPGPNVILLTASGARFGFAATLPHILGVALGVGVIAAVTGLGVGALLNAQPGLTMVLKAISFLWILWMAWGLWQARPVTKHQTYDRPFTFIEALLFQWVNPKIWAVALSAMAYVADFGIVTQATVLGVSFSCINLFVCVFWTATGTMLSYLLKNPPIWAAFMRTMAIALVFFSLLVFV
jgi:threonine/homoserine/homoserine lactone efflux protein